MHTAFRAARSALQRSTRPRRALFGSLLISASCGVQLCSAASPATPADTPIAVLDEVLIRETRLGELKAAIVKAEDRFYARYNELNPNDAFDIECAVDSRTGTKLKRRVCLTKLQRGALSDQGREYLQSLQETTKYVDTEPGLGKPPDTDPVAIWAFRYEEYRRNMLHLLQQNPDLRILVEEGEAARKRYETEYSRRYNVQQADRE